MTNTFLDFFFCKFISKIEISYLQKVVRLSLNLLGLVSKCEFPSFFHSDGMGSVLRGSVSWNQVFSLLLLDCCRGERWTFTLVRDHVPLTTGFLVTSLSEALPALSLVLVVPNVFNSQWVEVHCAPVNLQSSRNWFKILSWSKPQHNLIADLINMRLYLYQRWTCLFLIKIAKKGKENLFEINSMTR